jgi:hypothetical protein
MARTVIFKLRTHTEVNSKLNGSKIVGYLFVTLPQEIVYWYVVRRQTQPGHDLWDSCSSHFLSTGIGGHMPHRSDGASD